MTTEVNHVFGQDEAFALLPDGATIEIRQARPDDLDCVRQMHEQMSPDNTYLRFFSTSGQEPEREAQRLCRPGDADHAALLAFLAGRLVGVASYEPTGHPGVAEIAFAVADEMHGKGVATLLLEHLVSLARRRHLTAFAAETLPENAAMQRVFADAGLPVERHMSGGLIELTLPLPSHEGSSLDRYLDTVAVRASRADIASLRYLLEPSSVAVIGAGRRRGSVGREILHNIVAGGFTGEVYAVNPRGRSMEGLSCLASASDLPAGVDLAIVAVPPAEVAPVAAQCGRRGVRALVVITAGLDGGGGADLLAICRRYGMRLVGPNCFGVASASAGLNATFGSAIPSAGQTGLVVQSGGIGIALIEHLRALGLGVSSFASVGDKFDVSSNDMLTWWEQDRQTSMAVLYMESFGNPRGFARTARRVGMRMPILTVIGGRSAAGQQAAATHTASSATPLVTREALFGQAGVIATHSLGELMDTIAMLSAQPAPAGRRVAVVSNAGGAGVLAADACADNGLTVAVLDSRTRRRLTRLLPPGAAVTGPVDTTATVTARAFGTCLATVAADENVDAVLAVAVPTAIADLRSAILSAELPKPLAGVLLDQNEALTLPPEGPRVPVYGYPESAARALAHAAGYREWRDQQHGSVPDLPGVDSAGARTLVAAYLAAEPAGGWLAPADAAALLASYRIPMAPGRVVTSPEGAAEAAGELGAPVVVKADVTGVVHKTEAGAVQLDLRTPDEAATAYLQLADQFGDGLRGALVQPMLVGGVETLVGVVQEPVFGPLVVFGLGGVATDVLADREARLTPLTDADAAAMIRGIRAAPLLSGYRGRQAVDVPALADLLLRVSRLADDLPEVAELDLNPVIAMADGAHVVDVRVRLAPAAARDPFLRALR